MLTAPARAHAQQPPPALPKQADPQAQPDAAPQPDADKLYEQARRLRNISAYARAAERLSAYVRRYPKRANAPDALQDTVILQLGLGLHDEAQRSMEQFQRLYGRSKRRQAVRLAMGFAARQIERSQHARARKVLERWVMRQMAALAPLERIEAQGLLGHALAGLGRTRQADAAFKRAQALFGKLPLAAFRADTTPQLKQLGRTLTVLGEAHYRDAMKLYKRVLDAPMPRYRGPATQAAIAEHVRERVGPWMRERRQRITRAEQAFLRVIRIKPVPPPTWTVKSAARVAEMWLDTYHAMRNAPSPPMSAKLRDLYREQLDTVASPYRARARQALKLCIAYGAKYQSEHREVASCERKLARLDARTVPLDEVMPAARWHANAFRSAPLPDPRP